MRFSIPRMFVVVAIVAVAVHVGSTLFGSALTHMAAVWDEGGDQAAMNGFSTGFMLISYPFGINLPAGTGAFDLVYSKHQAVIASEQARERKVREAEKAALKKSDPELVLITMLDFSSNDSWLMAESLRHTTESDPLYISASRWETCGLLVGGGLGVCSWAGIITLFVYAVKVTRAREYQPAYAD